VTALTIPAIILGGLAVIAGLALWITDAFDGRPTDWEPGPWDE